MSHALVLALLQAKISLMALIEELQCVSVNRELSSIGMSGRRKKKGTKIIDRKSLEER